MKLHLYSDLNLRYFQHADPVDEVVPADTDIIVVCGSISNDAKRSLLFQESLVKNQKPVIVNIGLLEGSTTAYYDLINATQVRYAVKTDLNCYYSAASNLSVNGLDILNYTGWYTMGAEEYQSSRLKNLFVRVKHGVIRRNEQGQPIGYFERNENNHDFHNNLAQQEIQKVEQWLAQDNGMPKLLVTGHDARRTFKDYDLHGVTVCSTGSEYLDCEFNGGRLLCNPGSGVEARSRLFDV